MPRPRPKGTASSRRFATAHRAGVKNITETGGYRDIYAQRQKAKDPEYTACPRCGRRYKNPDQTHYSDPKNKTPCLPFKV